MELTKTLNKDNFFDDLLKSHPLSVQKFCDYIDMYKKSTNWNELFKEGSKDHANCPNEAPKFHEIPFLMQKGIIENFFLINDLLIGVEPHPVKVGFTWSVVDFSLQRAVWKSFLDDTYIDVTNYANADVCFIDCVNMAFQVLNENLTPKEQCNPSQSPSPNG